MNTIKTALKTKEIRKRLLFVLLMLVVIRFGSQLPVPGIDRDYFSSWFESQTDGAFSLLTAFTGGSFLNMSVFALSITPYITSSIIVQLLTIAFPKLEEIQKDGEEGQKKIKKITRYLTIILALISALSMSIGFGRQGLIEEYNALNVILMTASLTAGSAALVWIGDLITEYGIGNGISIVLLINITSQIPQDISSLFEQFVFSASVWQGFLSALVIISVICGMVLFVVVLNAGERRIPIQDSRKGTSKTGAALSNLPIKVNTAGVIPVIFASSILSFPSIVSSLAGYNGSGVWSEVLKYLSSSYWFSPYYPKYTLGVLIDVFLIVFFAYFYTQITFNPLEISDNLKKRGAFIPGIRPGKPTSDYLSGVLKYIILIGASGLVLISIIPYIFSGIFGASVSFGGTSIIIIASVIIETMAQINGMIAVRSYKKILD